VAITTLCISRHVCLPPLIAAAAFDAVHVAIADPAQPAAWAIVAPSAVLVARCADPLGGDSTLPRHAVGRLRSRSGWRSFPVEVELTAWSDHHSEVTVRPSRRWVPVDGARRQRRFCVLAHAVADHLATSLEAVVGAWDGDVVAGATAFVQTTNALRDLAGAAHRSAGTASVFTRPGTTREGVRPGSNARSLAQPGRGVRRQRDRMALGRDTGTPP